MEDCERLFLLEQPLSSSSLCLSGPNPFLLDAEIWMLAEQRAGEILSTIQPTQISGEIRNKIIMHLQGLIRCNCGSEAIPFGSVPLKTYLPDGDIDITALSNKAVEKDLAKRIHTILQCEEECGSEVKNVEYIHAQVEIVKCTVKELAVDISFNQIAGLSTLCFLEKVDELIGRDHLFKRSIILIKAWCYYESRIVGAPHGLLSTYGLETLVLYIINRYHSSLHGPLAVLCRFLHYYSNFDWDNYCVSINGPVPKSLLPEIVETLENDGDGLVLGKEFLQTCREVFSVSATTPDTRAQQFPLKYINIVDPLKHYNNLGRSVSQGSSYRIKRAFTCGAQGLRKILQLPGETMGEKLEEFFKHTLERNGRGQRPDVIVPVSAFGTGKAEGADLTGDGGEYYKWLQYSQYYYNNFPCLSQPSTPSSPFPLLDGHVMASSFQPLPPMQNVLYSQEISVPSAPPVQDQNDGNVVASPFQLLQCNRNALCCGGSDVFVPGVPLCDLETTDQSANSDALDKARKSRGTGTFIPVVAQHQYKEIHSSISQPSKQGHAGTPQVHEKMHSDTHASYKGAFPSTSKKSKEAQSCTMVNSPAAKTCSRIPDTQVKGGQIEVSSESKNEAIDVTVKGFPHPEPSSEASLSSLSDVYFQHSSGFSLTIDIGNDGYALPAELPSLMDNKLTVSGASEALDPNHSGPSSKMSIKRDKLEANAIPKRLVILGGSDAVDPSPGVCSRVVQKAKAEPDARAKASLPSPLEDDREFPPLSH